MNKQIKDFDKASALSDSDLFLIYQGNRTKNTSISDLRLIMKGDKGDPGQQGAKGEMGPRGEQGITGAKGEPGEPGAKGVKGAIGPQGLQGETGDPGKSVYDAAVEAGYTGTEAALSLALANLGNLNISLDAINGEVV